MINGHFQYQVGEIFSFKFELAIKGILVLTINWGKKNSVMNLIINNILNTIEFLLKNDKLHTH
jgi:hypothetical protein